jgi:hypothetical protein
MGSFKHIETEIMHWQACGRTVDTLQRSLRMLAHRFKDLLALASQAGKGFVAKYPLVTRGL